MSIRKTTVSLDDTEKLYDITPIRGNNSMSLAQHPEEAQRLRTDAKEQGQEFAAEFAENYATGRFTVGFAPRTVLASTRLRGTLERSCGVAKPPNNFVLHHIGPSVDDFHYLGPFDVVTAGVYTATLFYPLCRQR